MSFADLRSARKSKETKSFINPDTLSAPDKVDKATSGNGDGTEVKNGDARPAVVFDRPSGLPTTLEVRASTVGGRGVHATVPFHPGDF